MNFFYKLKVIFIYYCLLINEFFKNIFGIRRKFLSDVNMNGKVVLITGGSDGIGKETALQMSLRNAKIIIGCRNLKGKIASEDIRKKAPNAVIKVLKLDLSSLKSVRQFAKEVEMIASKIDILINNGGVMMCPEEQSEDGFEMQFATNHLGHFLLTLLLLPLLKKSGNARVVTISSIIHILGEIHLKNINLRNNAYTPKEAYIQSKLANILFTRELSKRVGSSSRISTYCLHPGIIKKMGAQTTLYCALEESIANENGFYYSDCKRVDHKWMVRNATDDKTAQLLWELSTDLVKLEDNLKLEPQSALH